MFYNRDNGIRFVKKSIRRYFKEHPERKLEDAEILYLSNCNGSTASYSVSFLWVNVDDLLNDISLIYEKFMPIEIWIVDKNDKNLICKFGADTI